MTVVNIRYENGERRKIGWIEGRRSSVHASRASICSGEDVRPLRRPDGTGCQPGDLIVRSVKD